MACRFVFEDSPGLEVAPLVAALLSDRNPEARVCFYKLMVEHAQDDLFWCLYAIHVYIDRASHLNLPVGLEIGEPMFKWFKQFLIDNSEMDDITQAKMAEDALGWAADVQRDLLIKFQANGMEWVRPHVHRRWMGWAIDDIQITRTGYIRGANQLGRQVSHYLSVPALLI